MTEYELSEQHMKALFTGYAPDYLKASREDHWDEFIQKVKADAWDEAFWLAEWDDDVPWPVNPYLRSES